MGSRLRRWCLLALALLLVSGAGPGAAWAGEKRCQVIRVHDGDTFTCQAKRRHTQVRVFGIDTPELDRAYGPAAGARAKELLLDTTVRLVLHDRDKYGRQVAEVFLDDGRSLAAILLFEGLARWYARFAAGRKDYADLEEQARRAKRGFWKQGAFPKR